MKRTSTLFAAALLVAGSGSAAFAKTYQIAISGVCDTLTLTETADVIVGVSNGADGCDDSYEVGSTAKVPSSVAPGGKILVAAGDLGTEPTQWVWYFNLKTGEAQLRGTSDGATLISAEFGFTVGKVVPGHSSLPKATDVFKQRAKLIAR